MKKIISLKLAKKAAREHFGVKKLHAEIALMGGNNPYWLFIHKGEAFEIR